MIPVIGTLIASFWHVLHKAHTANDTIWVAELKLPNVVTANADASDDSSNKSKKSATLKS